MLTTGLSGKSKAPWSVGEPAVRGPGRPRLLWHRSWAKNGLRCLAEQVRRRVQFGGSRALCETRISVFMNQVLSGLDHPRLVTLWLQVI